MINLCLVVIATQFSETKQREHALMKSEQRARQLHQSASTLASDSQPGSCYEEIIRYLAHLGRKACRRLSRLLALGAAGLRCACAARRRDRGVAEMNGLAHRHSGHVAGDLSHLREMYQQRHPPPPPPRAECRLSNGGFNYPVISPLHAHPDAKGHHKRGGATEAGNRLPQLVLEHGEMTSTIDWSLSNDSL